MSSHQLHTYACKGRDTIEKKSTPLGTIRLQYDLGLKTASKWMHHRRERALKPRRQLRFEEEPCSWTVHVAVRDSIERELMYEHGHGEQRGAGPDVPSTGLVGIRRVRTGLVRVAMMTMRCHGCGDQVPSSILRNTDFLPGGRALGSGGNSWVLG